MPIFYECQRCTACCRWPGQVPLSDEEITRLAAFKQMSEFDFIQRFTRLRHDRRGLTLMEKPGGECVFLEGNDCSVQPVKPGQCRDFPNLWNFPGFQKVCHAIPRRVGEDEFKKLLARASGGEPERGIYSAYSPAEGNLSRNEFRAPMCPGSPREDTAL